MTTQQAAADAARNVPAVAPAVTLPDLPALASPALRLMLDDKLFERAKLMAKYMAEAAGFVPRHLIGRQEACFAVVNRALVWNLDPYAVAACTYQTPNGAVGYEGKLVAAVLEASGRIVGGIEHEHFGEWSRIVGKFEKKKSAKGFEYAAPAWNPKDEEGLGVEIRALLRGEGKPRTYRMLLVQAYPRNSTLWALDPMTQLVYLATRRFANLRVPNLFMGLPFDREEFEETGPEAARDVTPARPTRADFGSEGGGEAKAKPAPLDVVEEERRDMRPTQSADAAAAAPSEATKSAANERGPHDPLTQGAEGSGTREGPSEPDEKAEREADRMSERAQRGEDPAGGDESGEPEFAATPVPTKKGGAGPDWIKWHATVAGAAVKLAPEHRAAFLAAHEPALANYAAASPDNAARLRDVIVGAEQ